MEQTNTTTFLSWLLLSSHVLCFAFLLMNSLGLIATGFVLTNETDHQALLAIKDSIPVDPLGALSSWNHSFHFCNWQGVSCGHRHDQRVTVLNLSSLGLVGSLSPHIGNLTFLRTIDLGNNSFRGEIPPEIGKLFRLQELWLWNNSFQGDFPTNLTHCSHLRVIIMHVNNLRGKIPTELGSLSNLSHLGLAANNLTGPIPLSIGNLSSLVVLSLPENNLDGSIPTELGQLSKLEFLQLTENNLFGMVPTSLYNISSIHFFSITFNRLHGILPLDLGLTLPNLQGFYVEHNQFYGPIPSSIVNATRLVQIDFSDNSFTGHMPRNLGTLNDLKDLAVFNNLLETNESNELMSIFASLSNCSNLHIFSLGRNTFKGLLPHSIANLSTKITYFDLQHNYISGSIPHAIETLVNVQRLYLNNNLLTGCIPNSVGKLSNLEYLMLKVNNISGEIPSSIGNLTGRLSILDLSINMIEGSIPVSLGQCTKLQLIHLGGNHLTGAIPQQIFGLSSLIDLILSQNYLTGLLPQEVGNLKNLEILNVSENKLSGEIPANLGSCEVLEYLHMGGNLFEGIIPISFEQLHGLQVLDVSRNNLSGQIPKFLGKILFQTLNLSYNKFDGEVPDEGVFKNISAFSIVGNKKLCGGIKVLQLHACPTKVSKEMKRPFTHRVIALAVTLTIALLLACLSAILYRMRRSKQEASSTPALQNQYLQLSYGELLHATNGFSSANLIGVGGCGSVYKGILNPGAQIIAVKVLNLYERRANKSFVSECEVLKNIRHRNLVKIITSCSSIDYNGRDFKALVFEFMENGSLESWLHPSVSEQQEPKNLNFVQRLNIAIDVAFALDYLHNHCEVPFIHCDLKPSNILLDGDLCAHVSDFGLAKILLATTDISNHQKSSSIGIRGTVGYVAPEYGMGEEVSTQGDMYSYGVLLLEMFTKKRPTNNMFTGNINLHDYVKMCLPNQVTEIVDPKIILEDEEEPSRTRQSSSTNISKLKVCLVSVFQIGVSCSAELPSERMSARDVLTKLHKIRNVFLGVRGQGDLDGRRNDS